ncbi:DUF3576 domain-containing protein [Litorivita sp. NS0012-18]|uniref:DUF3576 domain-containing protein n=1 Tax=Litorivita sp. NS0012-18 TaxID=3127655 RepID=UPI003341045C
MITTYMMRATLTLTMALALAACGGSGGSGKNLLRIGENNSPIELPEEYPQAGRTTIWDAFRKKNLGSEVAVNRYLWNASLETLNFLPIESVDPFTGVIVTGYGTPPGGGRAYRATIYIKDPSLDARSLNVALQTRSGPVAAGTQRAVEDAILARARQLRIADGKL